MICIRSPSPTVGGETLPRKEHRPRDCLLIFGARSGAEHRDLMVSYEFCYLAQSLRLHSSSLRVFPVRCQFRTSCWRGNGLFSPLS